MFAGVWALLFPSCSHVRSSASSDSLQRRPADQPQGRDPESDDGRHRGLRLGHARQPLGPPVRENGERDGFAAPVQINLAGARNVAGTATALPLAADPQATNSIDVPQNVVPVSAKLAGVKSGLTYTVPANAIVVLTLQTR